jgi:dipeptidase E
VVGAHAGASPLAVIDSADAVFTGGGNSFRLLAALHRHGLVEAIRSRVAQGLPYIGSSAGTNMACPTLRTTNDMPIVQPPTFEALNLVPFQINPHYPLEQPGAHVGETRDQRILEFLEENDVPVLGLCEGSWVEVRGGSAQLGGVAPGRLFRRGSEPTDVHPGADLSDLLSVTPVFDSVLR